MASDEAARRYAQAAFAIALDDGNIEQWRQDLADIASVLSDSELAYPLADERVPVESRQEIVSRVLDVSPKALNLAKLLIAKGRSRGARFVAMSFERMADEHEGRVQAELTSAIPLDDGEVSKIESQLSGSIGKDVSVSMNVDPAIIGGLVIRVGDQLIDGSIRTRLRRLQHRLAGAA